MGNSQQAKQQMAVAASETEKSLAAPEAGEAIDIAQLSDQAFVDLFVQEHSRDLYQYALRLANDSARAEDLVQQTLIQAWRRRSQLEKVDRLRSWLMTILRNTFLKELSRQGRELQWDSEIDLPDTQSTSDRDRFEATEIREYISKLPEEFRVVLLMFYFEELSYIEIAEQLQVKIGTVMSRLSRAKQKLKSMFEGEAEE